MTIADLFTSAEIVTAIETVLTEAGPYILALFGVVLVVGVGMGLLGKAKRWVLAHFR